MLTNKADVIEDYILSMFQQNQAKQVELKRTELADEISCAPSQVTYVLSTRFTNERGYKVESRRGLGGYIRITIVDEGQVEKDLFFEQLIKSIDEDTDFKKFKLMLDMLLNKRLITIREAELAAQIALRLYALDEEKLIDPTARAYVLQSIFKTFANIS